MISFPPCKINLGLQVLAKRPDGYHDISTCFFPLPLTDLLEILPHKEMSFVQTGLTIPGDSRDNLCMKAYHLLKRELGIPPIQLHLHKVIPMGAGLGGGSADGAHTIRLLNSIFNLALSAEQQMGYAQQLGSDCAFFMQDKPKLGSGRGEFLAEVTVKLKGWFLILIVPPIHVSTAEAYSKVIPEIPAHELKSFIEKPILDWKQTLKNDFEKSVFLKYPLIKSIKDKLYSHGATYASMSGSGSSVYGIFEKEIPTTPFIKDGWCWSGLL